MLSVDQIANLHPIRFPMTVLTLIWLNFFGALMFLLTTRNLPNAARWTWIMRLGVVDGVMIGLLCIWLVLLK